MQTYQKLILGAGVLFSGYMGYGVYHGKQVQDHIFRELPKHLNNDASSATGSSEDRKQQIIQKTCEGLSDKHKTICSTTLDQYYDMYVDHVNKQNKWVARRGFIWFQIIL